MFPDGFDPDYFSDATWSERLEAFVRRASDVFVAPNREAIDRVMNDPDTSVRVVINLRADSLIGFLDTGAYKNRYQLGDTEIGIRGPDTHRIKADSRVGTGAGHYCAAAAMGGPGIRYFGEYCLILQTDFIDGSTQLFDRDSYDVLFSPLDAIGDDDIAHLKGCWSHDIRPMVLMRVLPSLDHRRQVVTSGSVIDLVLSDQEFIEVHLHQLVRPDDVEQVVEAPETIAIESRILQRQRLGQKVAMHELEWLRRRGEAQRRMDQHGIRHRVVTQDGRGYQWR